MIINLTAVIAGSTAAHANAIRDVIACSYITTCDQNGACADASGQVTFEREPVDVQRHGEGTYRLKYDSQTVDMVLADPYAAMRWTDAEGNLNSLAGTGQSTMLWLQTTVGDVPTSGALFLTCEGNS